MKIKFFGAAKRVTGSCHMLIINGRKVLLDCGLLQGKDENEQENEKFNFNPKEIDCVILSHAHIDHSGRIPLLYKQGFKGMVICTKATSELCSVMLPDSGYIQEMEVEWKNRKRRRQGLPAKEPLYTSKIAELSTYLFTSYEYEEIIEVFPGLKVRFQDAGHLLGSAIVEIFVKEEGREEIKIVYSGDLGNKNLPLIKNPSTIECADYVIMETTYGNRFHEPIEREYTELAKIIKETFNRGGNVIIPSFAVGRTQEVLYILNNYVENNILNNINVYVDSPLAYSATKIFEKNYDQFNSKVQEQILNGDDPFKFEGLKFIQTPGDSMGVNKIQRGAVIISASGMCEAGRIRHHLKHNLWREECSIVFVGFQAEGTLGRSILSGKPKVKIFGEDIAINAHIYNLPGLSGHADRAGLHSFINNMSKKPKEIILVHGEKEEQESFYELMKNEGYKVRIASLGETYFINEEEIRDYSIKDAILREIEEFGEINEINKNLLLERLSKVLEE
ncbi:MBL fold metallo-hydrolase RNA specificity domain-containing protein [Hathewaya massiliensis]|uniref:MBL fold metallo-hydrolase RNA specificity domain-containing protein n=1 Tax=Hathewaya massiliensis TaxID=1964382 RepID=UPI00115C3A80|nr:MBL fold metallo-hydrolase [Hathewaya massiliensis]